MTPLVLFVLHTRLLGDKTVQGCCQCYSTVLYCSALSMQVLNSQTEDVYVKVMDATKCLGAYAAIDPVCGEMTKLLAHCTRGEGACSSSGASARGTWSCPRTTSSSGTIQYSTVLYTVLYCTAGLYRIVSASTPARFVLHNIQSYYVLNVLYCTLRSCVVYCCTTVL